MARSKFNSRALRQLAENLVDDLAEGHELPEDERQDCVTSLVRQWITYGGNATLIMGDQQVYLVLGKTPLGTPAVIAQPERLGWMKRIIEDRNINPDDRDEIIKQLNRGQSAEAINRDGLPLRLWVNPKERSSGVEPLVEQNILPGAKFDYRIIATKQLEEHFEDPDEREALACSVAQQWQQYAGHACVFLDARRQLHLKLTERDDGGCGVVATRWSIDLEPLLSSLGFSPEVVPELIARINLGQEIEFQDSKGIRSRLAHAPKARQVVVRPLPTDSSSQPSDFSAILCPKCGAVLTPWWQGERPSICQQCGRAIAGL